LSIYKKLNKEAISMSKNQQLGGSKQRNLQRSCPVLLAEGYSKFSMQNSGA
jgi:hypothetical protein